jgi:hypothetical protein
MKGALIDMKEQGQIKRGGNQAKAHDVTLLSKGGRPTETAGNVSEVKTLSDWKSISNAETGNTYTPPDCRGALEGIGGEEAG